MLSIGSNASRRSARLSADGFAQRLLDWHARHGRHDLPWQHPRTPYRVWLSEIMLQQTQVATVIPYFKRFEAAFPDVQALADAPLDNVLHLWSGLGYYARARNLHRAAVIVRDEYAGEFPADLETLMALPGIGRSTAGAIVAQAHGQRQPILDGNAKRVLARYFAVDGWPGRGDIAARLWECAETLTPHERVVEYTQAIMDLGASVCTRSRPKCGDCPQQDACKAHALGRQTDFPGRKPSRRKPLRQTRMLLIHRGSEVLLQRRPPSGIWGGLWSLPEIDVAGSAQDWCRNTLGAHVMESEDWDRLRHSFSHYDLDIHPLRLALEAPPAAVMEGQDWLWYNGMASQGIGLAAPVRALLDRFHERDNETK